MFITKKVLSRRAALRGLGVTVALPLFDSMVPALSAFARTAAAPTRRLGFVYIPNGANRAAWKPLSDGPELALSRTLAPLEPVHDHVTVLSGLRSFAGDGDHARAGSAWLTGAQAKRTLGADVHLAKSLDQVAADELGKETQFRSLQIAADQTLWNCDGYACSYANTLCWLTPTMPLPMQNNPRVLFERLFGDGSNSPETRRAQGSILDAIAQDTARLLGTIGAGDRARLDDYLSGIRALELRMQKMEQQSEIALPSEVPPGIPDSFDEHVKMMFDLQVLAYQADLTRVITFMLGRETSQRTFTHIGVPEAHHGVSHHDDKPELLEKLATIDNYHVQLLSYYAKKLASTPDGDGSLLDHTLISFGSGMSNGNSHASRDLPFLVVGGGTTATGGRHIMCSADTPLTNLHLSLLDKVGVNLDAFGDSTGRVSEL